MVQQLKAGLRVLIKIISSASFLPGTLNVIKSRKEFSRHLRSKCVEIGITVKRYDGKKTVQDHFQEQDESEDRKGNKPTSLFDQVFFPISDPWSLHHFREP